MPNSHRYVYWSLATKANNIYNKTKANKPLYLDNFTSTVRITTRTDAQCAPWPGGGHPPPGRDKACAERPWQSRLPSPGLKAVEALGMCS